MANNNHLEMLLDNFRFSEAIGYISALVDAEKISATRGEVCENFIRAYEQVVSDSLWNEEGMLILFANKTEDMAFKDIEDERKRLSGLIDEWLKNEKRPLLFFVSAYYAVSNVDGLRMKLNLDEILKEIKDNDLADKVSRSLGGYEKFQAVGNALENYYHLDDSIFEVIKNLAINIQP